MKRVWRDYVADILRAVQEVAGVRDKLIQEYSGVDLEIV